MPSLYLQCPCGQPIAKTRWRLGKRLCVDCGIAKGLIHNVQLNRKEGPAWDRLKEAWRAMIAEES